MSKFTDAFKREMASKEDQQRISEKIFYNSTLKDRDGHEVMMPGLGEKYYLHSKQTGKKIGWIKTPSQPGEAGYGWCNLPAYLKMEEPPEIPDEFVNEDWDEVDLHEYFDEDEIDRFQMYLDMGDPSNVESSYMSDGSMIDAYMDMQARLEEMEERGYELSADRDFDGWKDNRKDIAKLERDMEELAEQYRQQYPGSEIEDVVADMRDDQNEAEDEDETEY